MESDLEVSSMENGEFSFGPKDMSLDVKLTFARVCSLIDTLEDSEDTLYVLKKIQKEAKILMLKKKNTGVKDKFNESQLTAISGLLHPRVQEPKFTRVISNDSMREPLNNSSFFGDNSRLIHPARDLHMSQGFRPIQKRNPHDSVQLGAIPEEVAAIQDDNDANSIGSSSYQETVGDNVAYVLKKWSVKKSNNELFLTGVKMDRKGNVIEKDFISGKIIARPESDIVRTDDGEFLLEEPLSDPKKIIPEEVRVIFTKENYFPKFWRKALALWIEMDQKGEKQKKKGESKPTEGETNKRKKSIGDDKKNVASKANKKGTPSNNKETKEKKPTPKVNKKNTPKENKKATPKENKKAPANENKKPANKNEKKVNKGTPNDTVKKGRSKKAEKEKTQEKEVAEGKKADDEEAEKSVSLIHRSKNPLDSDDDDPIVGGCSRGTIPGLDSDSMFILPQTSLTPTALLNSIKKTTTKGRFTPPTEMFHDLYGQKRPRKNSSSNISFSHLTTNKNNNVVKRMAKAKSNTKLMRLKEGHKNPTSERSEESQLVAEVIRAAALKTVTTPPLLKKVFRDDDESEISDEPELFSSSEED